ncbi:MULTISPECIES: hypothetical protein [unclassified Virgibacillus]|uniref:hypothetical protein n=1 Tax=unclassified Virgibacillus TaxID=2620237 RepID=UPI0024DDFDF7|nr:hypothetical protein [Virgibacillus sp. LDC-1]
MKRTVKLWMLVLVVIVTLVACNNEEKNTDDENENPKQEEKQQETEGADDQNKSDEKEETETSGKKNIKVEDQLDLKIGDTGTFDTTIGTYEMTVEKAKLVGPKLDDVETELDNLILLDIRIKNISNEVITVDDIMLSMEVTDDLEGSGFFDSSNAFDSVEEFTGIIKPGEERTGQFITEVYNSETYYFREDPGNVAAGGSNQVIWNMPADEVK